MLDYLKKYQLIAEAIAVGLVILALATWWHSFVEGQQKIGYDKAVAEYNAKLVAAQQAAQQKERENEDLRNQALAAAAQRDQANRAAATAAASAADGLRRVIADTSNRVSAADLATARLTASTLATLFGDCAGKYQGLAEVTDRWANEARTLREAWPK